MKKMSGVEDGLARMNKRKKGDSGGRGIRHGVNTIIMVAAN